MKGYISDGPNIDRKIKEDFCEEVTLNKNLKDTQKLSR